MSKDVVMGELISEYDEPSRDAVHVACAPTVAQEVLKPGQPVGASGTSKYPIGIVDPFLKKDVNKGEKFWLILYPNTVTGMKHHWEHPSYTESGIANEKIAHAEAAITKIASSIGQSFYSIMVAADMWVQDKDYTYDNSEKYKCSAWEDHIEEFWDMYQIIRGKRIGKDLRESFWTCSC